MTGDINPGDIVRVSYHSAILPEHVKRKWITEGISDGIAFLSSIGPREHLIADSEFVYQDEISCRIRHSDFIRSGPGKGYEAVGYLSKGENVEISSVLDEWVYLPKKSGWFPRKYIWRIRYDR